MNNAILFGVCVLIWGSTWVTITYQLGEVHPVLSVAYRFTLAAFCLGVYCLLTRRSLRLPGHIHVKMAGVGLALYTLDYALLYSSQQYLISAVVAVMSSCIIYFNVVLRWLLFSKPVRIPVLVGATLGLAGMGLIFYPQFRHMPATDTLWWGIALAMMSFVFAAVGNVISERILDHKTPVIQMNFWAMSYGLVFLYGYALWLGEPFRLPGQSSYYLSLAYLSVFGSVLAFGAYMKLLKNIGSDRAAYVVLVYPIVALGLSSVFEDYQWDSLGITGVAIVLLGNAIAMEKITLGRPGVRG